MNDRHPILRSTPAKGHFHAVRFYDSEGSLCRTAAAFLGAGLALRQPALIIATPQHARSILRTLAEGFDVARLRAARELVVLDAHVLLSAFMRGDQVQGDRFTANAIRALDRARGGRKECTVRAYGEMVDLLWKDGNDRAAIQVERLWNRIAQQRAFSRLCAYAHGSVCTDAGMTDICREHTHVVDADGTPYLADADSLVMGDVPAGRERRRSPRAEG